MQILRFLQKGWKSSLLGYCAISSCK